MHYIMQNDRLNEQTGNYTFRFLHCNKILQGKLKIAFSSMYFIF